MTAPQLKAVFVGHTAAPSGAELATLRLLRAMRSLDGAPNVEPSVILTEGGPMVEQLRACGIPTSVVDNGFDSRSVTIGGSGWLRRLGGVLALVRIGWVLGAMLKARRADIVVAGSVKALVMSAVGAARARIPLVWYVHDRVSREYFGGPTAFLIRWFAWAVCDGFLANSGSTATTVRGRPTRIAYPGVVERAIDCRRPGRVASDTVISVVGRLTPWKGQDVFLRALARAEARPRQVYLVGGTFFDEEPYRTYLEALARELRLPVTFTGHVDDPTEILCESDILVHCSVIAEPFGQVVVEGLQAGCAVIATRPGGPAEIIEPDHSGLLVEAGDVAGLTGALDRLMADPSLRTRLTQAGRLRAQRFGIADSARTVADFLSDVVGERRA